jgi:hypothetical protein
VLEPGSKYRTYDEAEADGQVRHWTKRLAEATSDVKLYQQFLLTAQERLARERNRIAALRAEGLLAP